MLELDPAAISGKLGNLPGSSRFGVISPVHDEHRHVEPLYLVLNTRARLSS